MAKFGGKCQLPERRPEIGPKIANTLPLSCRYFVKPPTDEDQPSTSNSEETEKSDEPMVPGEEIDVLAELERLDRPPSDRNDAE